MRPNPERNVLEAGEVYVKMLGVPEYTSLHTLTFYSDVHRDRTRSVRRAFKADARNMYVR